MDGFEGFLNSYGLPAVFAVMLVKAMGVPVPIPADVIMLAVAARAAVGKIGLWEGFAAILAALVLGSVVQYMLARGPGRGLFYRFGPRLGLTAARLDGAAAAVRRGGAFGVALAITTPGVSIASVAACGLAEIPLGMFLPGMVAGSAAFLALHFVLGYAGGALLASMPELPVPWLAAGALALLAVGFGGWLLVQQRRRRRIAEHGVVSDAYGAWQHAACPACLVLGALASAPGDARARQPAPPPPALDQ